MFRVLADCNTYVENKSKGILSEAETKQIESNKFLQKFNFFKVRSVSIRAWSA